LSRSDIEEVRELIATKGVRAAAAALIAVCEDTKAAAPARATAGAALLRAAGMFEKRTVDDDTPDHELDGNQLQARVAKILARRGAGWPLDRDEQEDDPSVLD
jgi:hypothetical protein